ncbi:MAG: arylesterase [Alphaproteobacteria bacterium]|nr:arylesterase [Alphaproteobacteria bacterium]
MSFVRSLIAGRLGRTLGGYGLALLLVNSMVSIAMSKEPLRLLALGDSLTAGYRLSDGQGFPARLEAALAARGHKVTVIDAGVSGDTSAGGKARLDWVMGDRPHAAIVELGANDALRGVDPAVTERNLAAILDRFAAEGVPVLLAGMLAPPNLGREYGQAFKAAFERLAKRDGVIFYPFFLEGVASRPELNLDDGMHPNARGVQTIVDRILPHVERLLERTAEGRG